MRNDSNRTEYYRVAEMAAIMGIDNLSMRRAIMTDHIPFVRLGDGDNSAYLVEIADFDAWRARKKQVSTGQADEQTP